MRIMSPVVLGNEENIPELEKNVKRCNEARNLPPNVLGISRGFLDLSLDRVQWNVTSYPAITARVKWWGQSCDDAASLRLSSSSRNCINYNVCTNPKLFRKYLCSCEAVEVQFSAANKNCVKGQGRHIGSAFISNPDALLSPGNDIYAPVVYTGTHKIFSTTNAVVGVVKVTMKLVLFDDLLTKNNDPLTERNDIRSASYVKDYLSYKKDPPMTGRASMLSNYSSSSKVWSFLRGKEMSPRDEAITLRDLTESSPAPSVIEALDEELLDRLRGWQSKRSHQEELYRCHNPGSAKKKEEKHSKSEGNVLPVTGEITSGAGNGNSNQSNGGHESSSSNGQIPDVETEQRRPTNPPEEDYQGVFYVGGFRNQHPHNRLANVFAISKSVSNVDTALMKTNLSDRNLFINYLKLFPLRIEAGHLDTAMKQNSLTVEVWTRHESVDGQDVKLGTAAVSLHPFYVAFRSEIVRQRLFDLSMPVIAVDGWVMVQGVDGAAIGQLELILAMGTRRQVEYFVQTKELLNRRMETPSVSARSTESASSILGNFLENLSQQMAVNKAQVEQQEAPKRGELRKTSDLLAILQRSLATPPTPEMVSSPLLIAADVTPRDDADCNGKPEVVQEYLKVLLEIESAMHLPKATEFAARKKCADEPSSYATFEARVTEESRPNELVESVEGKVYSTHVVERSSNPAWNKQFIVDIPKDLLTHPEKCFIVKIWRKRGDSGGELLRPSPFSDVVVGFCTVDLKVLTAGLPEIVGSYNIVDFDGNCNGQLQLKLKPLQPVQHGDVLDTVEMQAHLPMLDLGLGADLSLSRTLKRKFTELDEITQRLRARLNDVTSSDLISSDDEFENDLNTSVDEVDEEKEADNGDVVDAVKDDFNWLGNLTQLQRQFVDIDRQLQRNSQTTDEILAQPGTSTQHARTANTTYTNGGGGGGGVANSATTAVESLETALKDAVLNDRPDTA